MKPAPVVSGASNVWPTIMSKKCSPAYTYIYAQFARHTTLFGMRAGYEAVEEAYARLRDMRQAEPAPRQWHMRAVYAGMESVSRYAFR